jgi:hypothetical protein
MPTLASSSRTAALAALLLAACTTSASSTPPSSALGPACTLYYGLGGCCEQAGAGSATAAAACAQGAKTAALDPTAAETACVQATQLAKSAGLCNGAGSDAGAHDSFMPASTTCSLLEVCCATLDSATRAGCNAIAQAGSPPDCANGLASQQATGNCAGICRTNADCGGGQVCNSSSSSCVACTSNAQCSGSTPVCDTSKNACVACAASSDCPASLPACVNHACVACDVGSQCPSGTCNGDNTCQAPACSTVGQSCGVGGCCAGACVSGTCQCPAGNVACAGECTDVQTDVNNCGQCGLMCGSGSAVPVPGITCQGARCTCPATASLCFNQECAYLQSDPTNCGTCGNVCTAGSGFYPICCSGVCNEQEVGLPLQCP